MIGADLGRAALLSIVPVASALGMLRIELLYAVALLAGALTVLFDVSHLSYLPSLVDRHRLVEGNSKLEVTASIAQVVGPGAGGVLVKVVGAPLAVLVDALSYIASALFLHSGVDAENVGNRFMLSPLEFARYIDELNDPCVQAYFDIGNSLVLWGYPQDWILTLGPRIKKLHLKDCKAQRREFVTLGQGDVDWPVVRRALAEVDYNGFCTLEPNYDVPEAKKNPRAYFKRMAKQIDLIFEGKSPSK
jgi:sugar phosphate isomerase/epimerase